MINGKNFYNHPREVRILITPLDWGLGHATRCIPIINHLISLNVDVYIAASGNGYLLLKKEFPNLKISCINGYNIKYSYKKSFLPFKLLIQSPKIFFTILKEHLWLKKFLNKNEIDAVISDNRFGMYNKKIISVYITHQLLIKTGNKSSEKFFQKLHYFFIKKFDYCWIPDYKENGLAGELSHPKNLLSNIIYIGPLSRFEILKNISKTFDIAFIISGPEPQREIFEKRIISQIKKTNKKILLVRGLPEEEDLLETENKSVTIINHLKATELNEAIQQADVVISRSGYTTIMDLVKINKNAVLVPTPGQSEQEYLSNYLMKKKYFYSIEQDNFFLEDVINDADNFLFERPLFIQDDYKKIINEFVLSIKSGKFATQ